MNALCSVGGTHRCPGLSFLQILAPAFKDALGWEPIAPQGSMYGMFKHTEASDIEALQKGTSPVPLSSGTGPARL